MTETEKKKLDGKGPIKFKTRAKVDATPSPKVEKDSIIQKIFKKNKIVPEEKGRKIITFSTNNKNKADNNHIEKKDDGVGTEKGVPKKFGIRKRDREGEKKQFSIRQKEADDKGSEKKKFSVKKEIMEAELVEEKLEKVVKKEFRIKERDKTKEKQAAQGKKFTILVSSNNEKTEEVIENKPKSTTIKFGVVKKKRKTEGEKSELDTPDETTGIDKKIFTQRIEPAEKVEKKKPHVPKAGSGKTKIKNKIKMKNITPDRIKKFSGKAKKTMDGTPLGRFFGARPIFSGILFSLSTILIFLVISIVKDSAAESFIGKICLIPMAFLGYIVIISILFLVSIIVILINIHKRFE